MSLYTNKNRNNPTSVKLSVESQEKLRSKSLQVGLSASDLVEAMLRNSNPIVTVPEALNRTQNTSLSLTKTAKNCLDEIAKSSVLSKSEVVEALIQRMGTCTILTK